MTEYKKQFFRLCIEPHLADLIEEQRASIDLFEFPDALLKNIRTRYTGNL